MMNDDFPADSSTTGDYTIFGAPLPAKFEETADVDWFRVSGLKKYFVYDLWSFRSTDDDFTSGTAFSVYDSESNLIWEQSGSTQVPGNIEYHHFGQTEDHFVSAAAAGSTGGYRFYARTGDYGGNTLANAENFAPNRLNQFANAIENNTDIDYLKYRLFGGVAYTFNLHGIRSQATLDTTLTRMSLRRARQ